MVVAGSLFALPIAGQQIIDTVSLDFVRIGAKNGLSQGMVTGIVQDPEGFIWFATRDGLNRYDGYRIKVYRHNPKDSFSLPDNQLCGIEIDQNGNFWIATTTHGLWRMDRQTERFYPFANPANLVWAMGAFHRSKHWIIAVGANSFKVFDTRLIHSRFIERKDCTMACFRKSAYFHGFLNMVHHHLDLLPDGRVLSYSFGDEMCIWTKSPAGVQKKCLPLIRPTLFRNNNTRFCTDNRLQQIWVFHESEILCRSLVDGSIRQRVPWPKDIRFSDIYASFLDAHRILIQIFPKGDLVEFDTRTLAFKCIQSNFIKSAPMIRLYIDRAGNQWFGSGGDGVAVLPAAGNRFKTKFPGQFIYALVASPDGRVIFEERKSGGICWFNPTTGAIERFNLRCEIPGIEAVAPVLFDTYRRNTWKTQFANKNQVALQETKPAGRPGTYLVLPRVEGRVFELPLLFIDSLENLWRVEADSSGKWYLRCINLRNTKQVETFRFPIANFTHLLPLVSSHWKSGNTLWLGTTQGLFAFDLFRKKWLNHYQHNEQHSGTLSDNTIHSICQDPKEPARYLWLGTASGLNKFDIKKGVFQVFTEEDGLPNDVIYGILNDEFDNLWLSTNKGLCCFTPPKNETSRHTCRNYTSEDGLANDEFNRYSFTKLADGTLVFGGTNGLTWFSPRQVLKTGKPPQMAITGFSIFNTPVDFRSDSGVVQAPFPYAKVVNLSHEQDMFRVEFASLDFGPESKKQYTYLLEGYDKKWIPGGTSNTATYTNLSPGTYLFKVKGTNSDGVWSKEEASLTICISPPWWGTWWFRVLAVFSFGGMLYGFYRYRLAQELKIIRLRDKIALDLHDEIGSTLSSISLFGEAARRMLPEDHKVNQVLNRINSDTKNMMESMGDIVWSINSRNDRFDNLVNRIRAFVVQVMEAKGAEVDFQVSDNLNQLSLDMEQRKNLFLLIKEAVNNAAKYSGCTVFTVKLHAANHRISLEIADNGKGFDLKTDHPGNGLLNMKKRANDLKASITVESELGRGTRIEVGFTV